MDLRYDLLRPAMLVGTHRRDWTGGIIRWCETGWNPLAAFNRGIANHVGLIYREGGKYWLAEVLAAGLTRSSLRRYMLDEKDSFVFFARHPSISERQEDQINEAIRLDLERMEGLSDGERRLYNEYDWMGLVYQEILKLNRNGSTRINYCSEYAEEKYNSIGLTWTDFPLRKNPRRHCNPWDQQKAAAERGGKWYLTAAEVVA